MQAHEIVITPPTGPLDAEIPASPSKAYTLRALFVAALAQGESALRQPLLADDQRHAITALTSLGARFQQQEDQLTVSGFSGRPDTTETTLYAGESGLVARLLTTLLTLTPRGRKTVLEGHPRVQQRPFSPLIDAIKNLGGRAHNPDDREGPPIVVRGGGLTGGKALVPGDVHSEFFSALLLVAPYAEQDVTVVSEGHLRSAPYVDMTLEVMRDFGVTVERDGYAQFRVRAGQHYSGRSYLIEGDHSVAAYFYSAAAITGGRVRVTGLRHDSRQGEKVFPAFLQRMGCAVWPQLDGFVVEGGTLRGIEVDVRDAGELLLPLAVVAAFARGASRFHGVGHLADREFERLIAVVDGLQALGIRTERQGDALAVNGGHPFGGTVDARGDFRVAMAFAVAGLGARGTRILGPGCVTRVFPSFFERLKQLVHGRAGTP